MRLKFSTHQILCDIFLESPPHEALLILSTFYFFLRQIQTFYISDTAALTGTDIKAGHSLNNYQVFTSF